MAGLVTAASCHVPGAVVHVDADATIAPKLGSYCISLSASGTRRFGKRYSTASNALPASLGVEAHGQKSMVARLDGFQDGVRIASVAQSIDLGSGTKDASLTLASCVSSGTSVSASSFGPKNAISKIADQLVFVHTGLEAAGATSFAALGTNVSVVGSYVSGGLQQVTAPMPSAKVTGLVAIDADADCADDLVLSTQGVDTEAWADVTNGSFVESPSSALPTSLGAGAALAAGDLDGDGITDIVGVGSDSSSCYVLLGNGTGGFTSREGFDSPPTSGQASVLGDFDGDGALDLVVGFSSGLRVWMGDGHGDFRFNGMIIASDGVNALATVDVNGDGKLDVLAATQSAATGLHVFLGDGKGGLTDSPSSLSADTRSSLDAVGNAVTIADVDGDCQPEVLFGGGGTNATPARLLRITNGSIIDTGPIGNSPAHAIGVADLDGDGVAEIVLVTFADIEIWQRQQQ